MRPVRSIPRRLHLTHTPLPDPDLPLAACAHDLVETGAWLLADCNAPLLSIVLAASQRDAAMPVMVWNADRSSNHHLARTLIAPAYRFSSVRAALERAADALLLALSPRWPAATPPPRLGIVTDGTGLGFCPDDPWPLAPGWLARRARDGNGLTCLLPFAPHGAWRMITGPNA